MPRDWERIREARPDITDWVIHWTRARTAEGNYESAFSVLQSILRCGYLKPSFAPRTSVTVRGLHSNTIQGPYAAVCFTDQPLSSFVQSCNALASRYSPYGIALEKGNLFEYGGRPAIYGDTNLLTRLNNEDKYFWVRYNPVPNPQYGNYPLDWTHEREWRAKIEKYNFLDWGLTPDDGVPLILPPSYTNKGFVISLPRILVRTLEEATGLRNWFLGLPKYEGSNGFIKQLYENFSKLFIVPIDFVYERITSGDNKWTRLETLPYDKLP
jgi:hypothetical protein